MTTKPQYEKKRTDNIELLFCSLFYLQRLDDCATEAASIKTKLMAEFDQFPVEFNKEKQASRYSSPYRYHESGTVTQNGTEDDNIVLLDPWAPENRPQKKKTETKKLPNYNALLEINPIWFLQVMNHKGRRTSMHRKPNKYLISTYLTDYRQTSILNQLPEDERKHMLTGRRQSEMDSACKKILRNFNIDQYTFRQFYESTEPIPFFFLNEKEIELLAKAIELDNPGGRLRTTYYTRHNEVRSAIESIMTNIPDDRMVIDTDVLDTELIEITVEESVDAQSGLRFNAYNMTITQHRSIWEQLHAQYMKLDEKHLNALRGFDMVDDDLLKHLKDTQLTKQ